MSGAPLPATSFFCRSSCWALNSPEFSTILTLGCSFSYCALRSVRPKSPQKLTLSVTVPVVLLPLLPPPSGFPPLPPAPAACQPLAAAPPQRQWRHQTCPAYHPQTSFSEAFHCTSSQGKVAQK